MKAKRKRSDSKAAKGKKVSLGVFIISAVGIMGSLIGILTGVIVAIYGTIFDAFSAYFGYSGGVGIGIAYSIIGIASLVGFVWLLRMQKKGYYVCSISLVVGIIIGLIFSAGGWMAIIPLIFLVYLFLNRQMFK